MCSQYIDTNIAPKRALYLTQQRAHTQILLNSTKKTVQKINSSENIPDVT